MKRPWLVMARSHEWNGRVGSRFSTKRRALKRARLYRDQGLWGIMVWYYPTDRSEIMRIHFNENI